MRIFRMPWRQDTVQLDEVILIAKSTVITRIDEEVINTELEEDIVLWDTKARITTIYEVYPDKESFERRVIPITMVKDTITSAYSEIEGKDAVKLAFEALLDREDDYQEFWKGTVDSIEI